MQRNRFQAGGDDKQEETVFYDESEQKAIIEVGVPLAARRCRRPFRFLSLPRHATPPLPAHPRASPAFFSALRSQSEK